MKNPTMSNFILRSNLYVQEIRVQRQGLWDPLLVNVLDNTFISWTIEITAAAHSTIHDIYSQPAHKLCFIVLFRYDVCIYCKQNLG